MTYVVVADRKQAFSAKIRTRRRSEPLHIVIAAKEDWGQKMRMFVEGIQDWNKERE